eukprot:4073751-Alexandrium_andersonii.AAC.1
MHRCTDAQMHRYTDAHTDAHTSMYKHEGTLAHACVNTCPGRNTMPSRTTACTCEHPSISN